jgi:hypothetical protein
MQQLANFIEWLSANIQAIILIQQALCVVLSGIFELLKLTKASKVVGTIAALDLGRIIRKAKAGKDVAKKAGVVTIALLLAACSGAPPKPSVESSIAVIDATIGATGVALAVTIDHLPPGTDLAPWQPRVEAITEAAKIVSDAGATVEDACKALNDSLAIAEAVDCAQCVDSAEKVKDLVCK